tara:strand:- start:401 stop:823 length:423 start_codon:yes stop_codon:yes gene_type:complete
MNKKLDALLDTLLKLQLEDCLPVQLEDVKNPKENVKKMNMFKLGNNGYSMTFENGYTVSVRWHHCINYITGRTPDQWRPGAATARRAEMEAMATDSMDAEVAVLDAAGEFLETPFNEDDTVIGYQRPDDVLKIMEWAAAL